MKKPSPRKVLLSTPPSRNHSAPYAASVIKPSVAEPVKTPTASETLQKSNSSDNKSSEIPPVNNLAEML